MIMILNKMQLNTQKNLIKQYKVIKSNFAAKFTFINLCNSSSSTSLGFAISLIILFKDLTTILLSNPELKNA